MTNPCAGPGRREILGARGHLRPVPRAEATAAARKEPRDVAFIRAFDPADAVPYALILAGGERASSEIAEEMGLATPMSELAGKPILEHQIDLLRDQGI